MEKEDFELAINELFEYFRFKDAPNPGVISRWYEKTSYIPKTALPWIVDRVEDNDSLPRNLPKLFQALWYAYKRENPDKIIVMRSECRDCRNMGFFFVSCPTTIYGDERRIQKIIMCSQCDNAKLVFGQRAIDLADKMTFDEIIANEYWILPHDKTLAGRKLHDDVITLDKSSDIKTLGEKIGDHLNPGERKIGNIPVEDDIPF